MDRPRGNRILDALPEADAQSILVGARVVTLHRGDTTTVQDRVMGNVDFPVDALMSVMGFLESGTSCEVASVGPEGFIEIDAALESDTALRSAVCQFGGDVVRMSIRDFTTAMDRSRTFAVLVRRAARARVFITEQIAMCNARHTITERLARWFLLASHRLTRGDFPITHEFVANALGVRRAGISIALGTLERSGVLAQHRGVLTIQDVTRLVEASCECGAICREAIDEALSGARI
jgi:Crp-like helix-turn-helix protein